MSKKTLPTLGVYQTLKSFRIIFVIINIALIFNINSYRANAQIAL